jgi:membrane protease YdiL (CAAX protease family)
LANLIFISTPWLGNVISRLATGEGRKNLMLRPNLRRSWRIYLALWLLPFLAVIVGAAIFYLVFPQSFDPSLVQVRALFANSPSAAADPWLILLSITLSIMVVSAAINTVVSIGEEFGWRAYLLPKLMERFAGAERASASAQHPAPAGGLNSAGARKAAVLVGVIHGVWHWPLIVLTASLVPGVTFLTLLTYLVFVCALSILLSWGTLRSGSVWPAALGHGTVNATSALPGFLLKGASLPLLGPDPTGLIGGIGFIILALVLFFNRMAFAGGRDALVDTRMREAHI